MKFRIWRDELFRLNLRGQYHERSHRLLEDLFGSWQKFDADFTRWAQARRSSLAGAPLSRYCFLKTPRSDWPLSGSLVRSLWH